MMISIKEDRDGESQNFKFLSTTNKLTDDRCKNDDAA